jgi:proline racemase/trans-L-3-hydroxyproline dehydratase
MGHSNKDGWAPLMKIEKTLPTVDLHTAGEPVRVLLGGVLPLPGKTMQAKQDVVRAGMDSIRTALMHEPRGHRDMFGALITPPVSPEAHFGLLFFDVNGYLPMCGHSTIGAAALALELGMVSPEEPYTNLAIDTIAGLIRARAQVEDRRVVNVTFRNVPSFLHTPSLQVKLPGIGEVNVDVAFGGNFFALVDASDLHVGVDVENLGKLVDTGIEIRKAVNAQMRVTHPIRKTISGVGLTVISDNPKNPTATARSITVFGKGQVDRSPCGTGTSAKMATLHAKGQLRLGEPFVHESIIGTLFEGKLVETTHVGRFEAVIPEITGSAYITGFHQFVLDSDDPLKYGFHLG